MTEAVSASALDTLFNSARTHTHWLDKDVPDTLLHQIIDLAKLGPTSANCSPLRVVFVRSAEAKARLKPFLSEGNADKTMKAPVTAIFANDREFYEHLPRLYPHTDARSWFIGKKLYSEETAFRNGSMQAAYAILAARSLGLDCGPMSGFDSAGVDEAFFKGTTYTANFLCNIGYGDPSRLHPRSPRFSFDEMARII